MSRNNPLLILLVAALALVVAACSTTKRIPDGELLYTGVKKITINTASPDEKLDPVLESQLKQTVNVAPNNSLYSPYVRHPFAVGLWVYNNWNVDSTSSRFKRWLYDLLVAEPVLISSVRPDFRTASIEQSLANAGYFGSTASYELIPDKDPKKAKLSYTINATEPYKLSTISLLSDTTTLSKQINQFAGRSKYLQEGSIYNLDSLEEVRVNISNRLRRRGYYYFAPEYIKYQADSTIEDHRIALRMVYADSIPEAALRPYSTGKVEMLVHRVHGKAQWVDTLVTAPCTAYVDRPSRFRASVARSNVAFKPGKLFNIRDIDRTSTYLSRLGMFRSVNITTTPLEDIEAGRDSIDVLIECQLDSPIEASIEVGASYKTNSYLGPNITAGIAHNNLWGGGERLSFDINGAFEWQLGGQSTGSNNYWEVGLSASLQLPRLLAPSFVKRTNRESNFTRFKLSFDLYNNPASIRFFQTTLQMGYEWSTNRRMRHEFIPFKLTYSKRLSENRKTDDQGIIDMNQMWDIITHRDEFIPQIAYTFTYSRRFGQRRNDAIGLRASVAESGNIIAGIYGIAGKPGGIDNRKLFGVPFSQYVKLSTQLTYAHTFFNSHVLAARLMVGAGFVYGNSGYMPYGEDFYAGGPNSIRAFPIRFLGPGRFRDMDGFDIQMLHSGSFQFIANLEYRFPILGYLKGAVFLDAGNVWLLKDPDNVYKGLGTLRANRFFKDLALGTGIGLRFDMSMIVLRLDVGYALHAPYDTGKSGYFNMQSFKKSVAFNIAVGYPF